MPTFFTDGTYRSYLHPGEIVFPLTKHDGADFMWQATADMYFRVPQGSWPLVRLAEGASHFKAWAYTVSPPGEISPPSRRTLERFLQEHQVDAIVAEQGIPGPWTARLRSAASREPVTVDGVSIYRVGIGG